MELIHICSQVSFNCNHHPQSLFQSLLLLYSLFLSFSQTKRSVNCHALYLFYWIAHNFIPSLRLEAQPLLKYFLLLNFKYYFIAININERLFVDALSSFCFLIIFQSHWADNFKKAIITQPLPSFTIFKVSYAQTQPSCWSYCYQFIFLHLRRVELLFQPFFYFSLLQTYNLPLPPAEEIISSSFFIFLKFPNQFDLYVSRQINDFFDLSSWVNLPYYYLIFNQPCFCPPHCCRLSLKKKRIFCQGGILLFSAT